MSQPTNDLGGFEPSEDLLSTKNNIGEIEKKKSLSLSENSNNFNEKKKIRKLTPDELNKYNKAVEKSGVIYISRIPPYMKPEKIRHLLSQYGKLGRLYLKPENNNIREKRKKMGGNRKRSFSEGWVEFEDKKLARKIATFLNNAQIGGKKRDRYFYDLWNLKYLPRFKWHHLNEKAAYKRAVREKKLRLAISQSTRENNFFLENVSKNKILQSIKNRKKSQKDESQHS